MNQIKIWIKNHPFIQTITQYLAIFGGYVLFALMHHAAPVYASIEAVPVTEWLIVGFIIAMPVIIGIISCIVSFKKNQVKLAYLALCTGLLFGLGFALLAYSSYIERIYPPLAEDATLDEYYQFWIHVYTLRHQAGNYREIGVSILVLIGLTSLAFKTKHRSKDILVSAQEIKENKGV